MIVVPCPHTSQSSVISNAMSRDINVIQIFLEDVTKFVVASSLSAAAQVQIWAVHAFLKVKTIMMFLGQQINIQPS